MNKRREIAVVSTIGVLVLVLATGGSARAAFYFGAAQNVGAPVNSPAAESTPRVSPDGLELYFCSDRPGGSGATDIWVSKRQSVQDPWGPPTNLGPTVNGVSTDLFACLSSDGLTLYFSDYYSGTPRPGGLGGRDIWMTTRPSRNDLWGTPANLGEPINSSANEVCATISTDGLLLIFSSTRAGGSGSYDLWMSTRATVQDPWGPPANLGPNVNTAAYDCEGVLSSDGLALVFCSNRPAGMGTWNLWMTMHKSRTEPWGLAVNLGPVVNSGTDQGSPSFSPDMKAIYFGSLDRPGGFGGYDLWQAPILPVVDFDGDGVVGIGDLVRLIESWGKDDPAVDIGPGPWGDGIVDAKDLEVLMSYWGQEVHDPTLIAHWKLDETSGMIAADSAGSNNGTLIGAPSWQPTGGKIGGALKLDGGMRFVMTRFVCDPLAGPFSALAWVKGGVPGQIVLSQANGTNWLGAAAGSGALAGYGLTSSAVITEGAWHRVGFAWDGSNRILSIDGVEVARDTLPALSGSTGGLYIGGAYNLAPGSFWSGLIDDIRIYNRAMKPVVK